MEKSKFNFLVNNYNSLSQQETAELRLEQDRYGYCQVLHQLIARGDQDNQTDMKDQSLHIAAVYSTDRSVLKQIMTEPRSERTSEAQSKETPVEVIEPASDVNEASKSESSFAEANKPKEEKPVEVTSALKVDSAELKTKNEPIISQKFDLDDALSKFLDDQKTMQESKLAFEKALEQFEHKNHENHQEINAKPVEEKPKRRGRPKKKVTEEEVVNTSEQLLEEIKTSKKKVSSENQKHKEQSEIIDQFIKTKPTISKPSSTQVELDLTEGNESYNENVVSETLALILIKQGKKEKAIEVLRKLIWKFPQKKAYFAAQIEDLTK